MPYRERPPIEKVNWFWDFVMNRFMITLFTLAGAGVLCTFFVFAFRACEADIAADKEVELQRLKLEEEQVKNSANGGCRDTLIGPISGKSAMCPHPNQRITDYNSWSGRYTCSCVGPDKDPKEKPKVSNTKP